LFKDAFISWPEARVEQWLQQYWQAAQAVALPVPARFSNFYRDCDLMGAQRHLKVMGIFARICYRDGKPKYLQDAPRFFNYLRGVCERRPELKQLALLLNKLPVPA
jgi:aminoglycoside/choline kinase family phosphotransferase